MRNILLYVYGKLGIDAQYWTLGQLMFGEHYMGLPLTVILLYMILTILIQ